MCELDVKLINGYDNYMWSYDFPKWYSCLELNDNTPQSFIYEPDVIIKIGLEGVAKEIARDHGPKSMMIKDFLKSR